MSTRNSSNSSQNKTLLLHNIYSQLRFIRYASSDDRQETKKKFADQKGRRSRKAISSRNAHPVQVESFPNRGRTRTGRCASSDCSDQKLRVSRRIRASQKKRGCFPWKTNNLEENCYSQQTFTCNNILFVIKVLSGAITTLCAGVKPCKHKSFHTEFSARPKHIVSKRSLSRSKSSTSVHQSILFVRSASSADQVHTTSVQTSVNPLVRKSVSIVSPITKCTRHGHRLSRCRMSSTVTHAIRYEKRTPTQRRSWRVNFATRLGDQVKLPCKSFGTRLASNSPHQASAISTRLRNSTTYRCLLSCGHCEICVSTPSEYNFLRNSKPHHNENTYSEQKPVRANRFNDEFQQSKKKKRRD